MTDNTLADSRTFWFLTSTALNKHAFIERILKGIFISNELRQVLDSILIVLTRANYALAWSDIFLYCTESVCISNIARLVELLRVPEPGLIDFDLFHFTVHSVASARITEISLLLLRWFDTCWETTHSRIGISFLRMSKGWASLSRWDNIEVLRTTLEEIIIDVNACPKLGNGSFWTTTPFWLRKILHLVVVIVLIVDDQIKFFSFSFWHLCINNTLPPP